MKLKAFWKKIVRDLQRKKDSRSRNAACLIGDYYLDKYGFDKYIEVVDAIKSLGITNIDVKGKTITITLVRPGLFIGKKGKNIDSFMKYMKEKSIYEKLELKENNVIGWLMPPNPNERYDDWDDF